ncbi:hypothetical protein, partial [Actinosynnema sp.]|uniref:hypothetical protein n=1 Tax=Actinosynnema sp. TaxID=1872144 RepID=UPI003F84A1D2
VDEALDAGIEHLIFVTGRSNAVIEEYLDIQVELEQKLLPPEDMYLALKQAISLGLLDAVVQGLF